MRTVHLNNSRIVKRSEVVVLLPADGVELADSTAEQTEDENRDELAIPIADRRQTRSKPKMKDPNFEYY